MCEDEENIIWIRQEFGVELLLFVVFMEWNIIGSLFVGVDVFVYCFLFYKIQGEGFFFVVFCKLEEDREVDIDFFFLKKKKLKGDIVVLFVFKENLVIVKSWLVFFDEYNLLVNGIVIIVFLVYY